LADRARRVLAHEWTLAALAALLISLFLNRGALADPLHTLPQDIWDPSLVSYLIAWDGHALLHEPVNLWQTNTFYPAPYALAYTDSLLAYAPAAFLGTGPEAAVLRYNILFILAQALVLFGGYVLARQLGAGLIGAALAGVAVAVAPWRLAQAGHLQILSVGGMFLALAMLARGHGVRWRRREGEEVPIRPGWAIAGWLVATWQLAVGFGVGLPFVYVLLGCLVVGVAVWAVRRRPLPSRRLLLVDGLGGLLFGAVAVLLARPYLKVLELYPYTKRDASWVALYSPPVSGLFTAPAESNLWGDAHAAARAQLSIPGEMALLPGFFLYALAAAGLFFSIWPLVIRLALGVGAAATLIFSLGTQGPLDGHLGYLLLLNLPGFEGIRTPGRLMLWATLLLALLAAGAVGALVDLTMAAARRSNQDGRPPFWAGPALLVPVVLVFVEGLGTTPHAVVPPAPPTLSTVAGPVLVLPTDQVGDMPVMLWSTDGFPLMVNGGSGVVPTEQDQLRRAAVRFPEPASVDSLRGAGIRTVVIVRSMVGDQAYQQFSTIPIQGMTRDVHDDAVVFTLG